jgi:hypothetical protein
VDQTQGATTSADAGAQAPAGDAPARARRKLI